MPEFAFPQQLVSEILELWAVPEPGETAPPPLPPRADLLSLVEVAYLVSQMTEEGRPLTFTLCCTPVTDVVRREAEGGAVEAWEFTASRAYSVQELRRLAVATTANSGAIWVQFEEDPEVPLRVRGLLNLGISWAIARMGLTDQPEPLPHAFLLRVEGPGTLTIFRHQAAVLSLSEGRIRRAQGMSPRMEDVPELLTEGAQLLAARFPASDRTALLTRRAYMQVLLTIVNGIRLRQHGGALIVAASDSRVLDPTRAWVRPTYPVVAQASYLADHVLASVQARLMVEAGGRARMSEVLDLELRTSSLRLMEAANFVANLSGTDGATVLRSDLTLVGFGVEIAVKPRTSTPTFEIVDGSILDAKPLDVQQFGMRHRSALWLCASAPDVVAFVVSQDGTVSLVFSREGQVYVLPNLETHQVGLDPFFGRG
jgi:hypothetical protein